MTCVKKSLVYYEHRARRKALEAVMVPLRGLSANIALRVSMKTFPVWVTPS